MRLFTGREQKMIGIGVAAATVVALAITIPVGLARRPKNVTQPHQSASAAADLPYITEIVIPEEFTLTGGERWYFSRDQLSMWNEEQIQEFWIDPASISIDLMTEESDRVVQEFFEGLP